MARVAQDNYPTPQALADAICRWLAEVFQNKKVFVEPSCGEGRFIKSARASWPVTDDEVYIGVDIDNSYLNPIAALGVAFVNGDFIKYAKILGDNGWLDERTLVFGNPPYCNDLPQQFIQAVMDNAKPGCDVAFLLRQSFAGSLGRAVNFPARDTLRLRRDIAGRPKFNTDSKSQDNSEYNVLVFTKGHSGHYTGWEHPLLWKPSHITKYGWR